MPRDPRYLLPATPHFARVMVGVLARAQEKYPVKVHAAVAASSHYHLILTPEDVDQLGDFMDYFNGGSPARRITSWTNGVGPCGRAARNTWHCQLLFFQTLNFSCAAERPSVLGTSPSSCSFYGEHERSVAFDERSPYADSIRHGYPRLRAEAERLRATGVPVYDLSDLFDELEAEAYRDSCCHYTDFGQEALAGAIAEIAASAVSATGTPLSTP